MRSICTCFVVIPKLADGCLLVAARQKVFLSCFACVPSLVLSSGDAPMIYFSENPTNACAQSFKIEHAVSFGTFKIASPTENSWMIGSISAVRLLRSNASVKMAFSINACIIEPWRDAIEISFELIISLMTTFLRQSKPSLIVVPESNICGFRTRNLHTLISN